MGKPLYVLIVEDSDDDASLLIGQLLRNGYEPNYERVETADWRRFEIGLQAWKRDRHQSGAVVFIPLLSWFSSSQFSALSLQGV